jgi:predicted nuclease of restriction endonuclease-like (RecB) superfamily
MNKKLIKSQNTGVEKDYKNLVNELQGILDKGLYTAYKAVDNIKVQTYWQIGERIVREELKHKNRADYGVYLVKKLVVDLGIKRDQLFRIIQFYRIYPIVGAVHRQLSWYHYLELIKVDTEKERKFYEQKVIQNSWSYRKLKEQIKNTLYKNTSAEEIKKIFQTKLPEAVSLEVFKNDYENYNFHFLPTDAEQEKDIEEGIVKNIDKFLTEFGDDFCFFGRQVAIKMDNKTHYIDLVLFHKGIPCTILVDLKSEKINSRDVGQMNKYVSYWRRNKQYEYEQDAIGLILSKEINHEEVAYALEDLEKKIFIKTYQTKLPSDEKIKKAIKKLAK